MKLKDVCPLPEFDLGVMDEKRTPLVRG